jgi:uncharacterized membrane protein
MVAVATPTHTKTPPKRRRKSWTVVTLSSLAIVAVFVGQYAQGTLNELAQKKVGLAPTYAGHGPLVLTAFYGHIIFAGIALAIGPFQFAAWLRNNHPAWHRWTGRTYIVVVFLGSISAFVMSFFNSTGIGGFFGFAGLAVLWSWSAWRGYRAAREKRFREHQSWMIRNFAMTYAAVSLRLWLGVLIFIQLPFPHGDFNAIFKNAYAPLSYAPWITNVIIAELIIRKRGLPALRMTSGNPAPRGIGIQRQAEPAPNVYPPAEHPAGRAPEGYWAADNPIQPGSDPRWSQGRHEA